MYRESREMINRHQVATADMGVYHPLDRTKVEEGSTEEAAERAWRYAYACAMMGTQWYRFNVMTRAMEF
eukprot:5883255-Pyramimonas_sp.AAC.1